MTSSQTKLKPAVMPKPLFVITVLYVGLTQYANAEVPMLVAMGSVIVAIAGVTGVKGQYGDRDKVWIFVSAGVAIAQLIPKVVQLARG